MNQILNGTNFEQKPEKINNEKNIISLFKVQFVLSLFVIIIIFCLYFYYRYSITKKEQISNRLIDNYNISRLYTNSSDSINSYTNNNINFSVIGLIEISKLNISYPILSEINSDLLKIAPCKVSGPMPNEYGNLCIAGHNYDNYKFFSKISFLNVNDEIIIYDANGSKHSYFVFNKFEVKDDDLSPLDNSDQTIKQITLITCNNSNSNRIIVQAKV